MKYNKNRPRINFTVSGSFYSNLIIMLTYVFSEQFGGALRKVGEWSETHDCFFFFWVELTEHKLGRVTFSLIV